MSKIAKAGKDGVKIKPGDGTLKVAFNMNRETLPAGLLKIIYF